MKQKKFKYAEEDQEDYFNKKKLEKLSKTKKSIKKKRKLKDDFTNSDDWHYEG